MADNSYVPSARSVSQILEDLKKEKQQAKQQSDGVANKVKNFFTSAAKKTGSKVANKATDIASDAAVKGVETAVFGSSFSGMNPKGSIIKTAIGFAGTVGGIKAISEFLKDDDSAEKPKEESVSDDFIDTSNEEKTEEKAGEKEDKLYVPDEANLDAQAGIAGANAKKGRPTKIMPFTEKQLEKMDHDQLGRINPRRLFVGNNDSPTLFDYSKQAFANMYGPLANIAPPAVKSAGKVLQATNAGFADFEESLADAFEQSPSFEEYAAEYQDTPETETPETEAVPAAPEKSNEDKTAERIAMADEIAPSAEPEIESDFSFGK